MEPTQVIIRPIISEKSFALAEAGKYTFRVHDHAHKTQIRQAIERAVRRQSCRGPDLVGEEQAEAPRPHLGPLAPVEEGDRRGPSRSDDPDLQGFGGVRVIVLGDFVHMVTNIPQVGWRSAD